jgi:hypothetical protein
MCLSDLHLGDARSVLSGEKTARSVVERLAHLAGEPGPGGVRPEVDTLVLNGDIWEECVPSGMVDDLRGYFQPSVLEASSRFFGHLLSTIDVRKIVWIPGNHDLSLWALLVGMPSQLATPTRGLILESPIVRQLLGVDSAVSVAYPGLLVQPAADDFPYVYFTHGHLLDRMVRGLDSEATYMGLRVLGCPRPRVPIDPSEVSSVVELARLTDPFTLSLWERYSRRDYLYSNKIMRRLDHPTSCPLQVGLAHVPRDGKSLISIVEVDSLNDPSSPRDGLMAEVPFFLDVMTTDPRLPTPVGSLRPQSQSPAFTRKSCLVYGHDHLGSSRTVVAAGVPYVAVDSGGWTSEYEGHKPHSHVLVWREMSQVVPDCHVLLTSLEDG